MSLMEHVARRRAPTLATTPTRSGLKLAAEKLLYGVLPPVLFLSLMATWISLGYGQRFGFDFKPLWEAARHVLTGASPYPAHISALRNEQQFVYPPIAALVAAPVAFLPFAAAATVYALVLAGLTALTLRILGVSDWRCYGLALLWLPVIEAIALGTITIPLALGLAVAWRYRDHPRIGPLAVAALIAAKVFLWPLLLWFVATRRGVAAVKAVVLAVVAVLASWTVIGFAGFTTYPRLLDELARLLQWKSYSLTALVLSFGFSPGQAHAASFVCGAAVLGLVVLLGRRGGADADRHGFILAIAAAFVLTPIVWMHYLALLLVPIAITRSRLTPLWFVPLAMWVTPGQSHGHIWRVAIGFSVWAVVLVLSMRPRWPVPSFGRMPAIAPVEA
jgi:alpha-1,2-mannosyltransferase